MTEEKTVTTKSILVAGALRSELPLCDVPRFYCVTCTPLFLFLMSSGFLVFGASGERANCGADKQAGVKGLLECGVTTMQHPT